jgi:hypothetical protein
MHRFVQIIEVWVALNFAIPAFILYQRSPSFRHRIFRWTARAVTPTRECQLAHELVVAARYRRPLNYQTQRRNRRVPDRAVESRSRVL